MKHAGQCDCLLARHLPDLQAAPAASWCTLNLRASKSWFGEVDPDGRRLVVRNRRGQERRLMVGPAYARTCPHPRLTSPIMRASQSVRLGAASDVFATCFPILLFVGTDVRRGVGVVRPARRRRSRAAA